MLKVYIVVKIEFQYDKGVVYVNNVSCVVGVVFNLLLKELKLVFLEKIKIEYEKVCE